MSSKIITDAIVHAQGASGYHGSAKTFLDPFMSYSGAQKHFDKDSRHYLHQDAPNEAAQNISAANVGRRDSIRDHIDHSPSMIPHHL